MSKYKKLRYTIHFVTPTAQLYYDIYDIFTIQSGARLTKAYDVTIQRYRNSHAKTEDS